MTLTTTAPSRRYLDRDHLTRALNLRDLTDPAQGPHAMQDLLARCVDALADRWPLTTVRIVRRNPIVSVTDNYDRLGFSPDDVTRDERYSRYVSPTTMLRSHTSADVPATLAEYGGRTDIDELLVLPGLAYRRDAVDRTHVGEPHMVDLWRLRSTPVTTVGELEGMIATLVEAVLPGADWRAVSSPHPYTIGGRQIDVRLDGDWLELSECGVIAPHLLRTAGLDPRAWSGLALGMGLDRALMLRKGLDDVRALRSPDPRVSRQMLDLEPWRPVSSMPPIVRDLSVVIDEAVDDEELGDRVRGALVERAADVERVSVVARTPCAELPSAARARLGIENHQVNALVRLVLRPLTRTLTDGEANGLRNDVYVAIHEGPHAELADGAS